MSDIFASARQTINRAKHHIDDLNTTISAFINAHPWQHIVEDEGVGDTKVHKIKFTSRLAENAPCIIFDAANNLRAALDQFGYACARAGGIPDPKQCKFPFGDDLPGLQNVLARRGSSQIPSDILTLFLAFKPYKGGNDTLWSLNKLCNTKKHCALVPVGVGDVTMSFTSANKGGPTGVFSMPWDRERNEIVFMRTGGVANTHLQYNAHVRFTIAFGEAEEVGGGQSPVTLLNAMAGEVERVLMATETECRRLGLIS